MAKKKRKIKLFRLAAVILVIAGFLGMAYYPASEMIDAMKRKEIIESLDKEVSAQSSRDLEAVKKQAQAWNARLAGKSFDPLDDGIKDYEEQMEVFKGSDLLGWLNIPKISLEMPVYHGTDEGVLAMGAGHLKSSSLPIGGSDTHSVISAHSGMSDQRAFDDIRDLEIGDYFAFKALDEWIGYRVEKIETVWPDETDSLKIISNEDWMSLVTCTPYGINDHRLLVHGKRAELPEDFFETKAGLKETVTNRRVFPLFIFLMILVLLFIGLIIRHLIRAQNRKRQPENSNRSSKK